MFRRFFQGEQTVVSPKTELGIPVMTYVVMMAIGCVGIVGWHISSNLWVMMKWFENDYTFVEWFSKSYAPYMSVRWPMIPFWCILWCISVPPGLLFFRLTIEQVFKQWKTVDVFQWLGVIIPKVWTKVGLKSSKYNPPEDPKPTIRVEQVNE